MEMDERIDELTRRPTVVVGSRQKRPNLPTGQCPFCPAGSRHPSPTTCSGSRTGGRPCPTAAARWCSTPPTTTPQFWSLGLHGARRVVELWAERTAALGARDDVDYVFGVREPRARGRRDHRPPARPDLRVRLGATRAAARAGRGGARPRAPATGAVVARRGNWTAWVPEAAVWPYELRLADAAGVGSLTDPHCDRDGLAAVLIDVLARLDQLFDAPMPYMMWFHQRPTDGEDWPRHTCTCTSARSTGHLGSSASSPRPSWVAVSRSTRSTPPTRRRRCGRCRVHQRAAERRWRHSGSGRTHPDGST